MTQCAGFKFEEASGRAFRLCQSARDSHGVTVTVTGRVTGRGWPAPDSLVAKSYDPARPGSCQ
eukprot:2728300-Rhodomonas_salina.1